MAKRCALGWLANGGVLAAVLLAAAVLAASEPIKGVRQFNPYDPTVEIFSAVEAGQLEVRLVAKDSTECRVLITNKTERPLNVSVPAALAGVPVLAQNLPGFADGVGPANNSNAPQRLGIGNPFNAREGGNQPLLNLPNGQQRGRNAPFAPFNVAPEAVAQLRLAAVCLDPGKPNPKPAAPYQLCPLKSVSEEPGVAELCAMLARGELSQRAAQAAAWHLNNHLSWDQLRAKRVKVVFLGVGRPMFTKRELAEGEQAADKAIEAAKAGKTGGKQGSLTMN